MKGDLFLITINIGIFILICVACMVIGFIIAAAVSGSKIKELDNNIKKQKVTNGRQDYIIHCYKESNANANKKENNSKTANTDGRKNK